MDSTVAQRIKDSFDRQGLLAHLGVQLDKVESGHVELVLPYADHLTQQQGGYHGGAMGTLADVAAGYAGLSVAPLGVEVATVEYKINFLAAFQGGQLRAVGRVVRAGARLIITTAHVQHEAADGCVSDCAIMQQTLAIVTKKY